MEITRKKLSAKLDTIPEADREPYVAALKAQGYTWKSEAMKDAPASPRMATDAGEALLTNLPTQGFKQDLVRGLPAAGGGMVGATAGAASGAAYGATLGTFALPGIGTVGGGVLGGVLGGIGGAFLGGSAGEATRQAVAQTTAGAFPEQQYPMATGREVLRDVGIQGATQAAGQALGVGVGAVVKGAARGGSKILSQTARAMTGTPEKSAAYLLENPGMKALPIEEAGKVYRSGVGNAANGSMEAGRSVFGKTYPGPEAAVNTFDEIESSLGAAKPEEILGMRQTMMDTLSDTPVTSPKLRMMLAKRIEKLDGMLDSMLPDWGGAKQAWREAKIGEDFGSWLPLNKNLSPNVLRTAGAVAAAASSASKGELLGLAALPLISPKVWGVGLRGVGYAAKVVNAVPPTVYRVGTQATAGASGSALADAYGRLNRQIPQPDPAFQAIGGMRPTP